MTVRYVPRSEWGAGPHGAGYPQDPTVKVGLVVHHTVMDRHFPDGDIDGVIDYMRTLQHARPDLGDEVPYNFVVFPGATPDDGIVAEGRGNAWSGAHTVGYNTSRLGCAYAGNASEDEITAGVLEAYNWIGAIQLVGPAGAARTIGHRDTKSTECPGNNLYARLDRIQPPFTYDEGGLTMAEAQEIIDTLTGVIQRQGRLTRAQAAAIEKRQAKLGRALTEKEIDEISAAIEADA